MNTGLDSLARLTCRISAESAKAESDGTGFFFEFEHAGKLQTILITNGHVLAGMDRLRLHLPIERNSSGLRRHALPTPVPNVPGRVVTHPDNKIDLAAVLLTDVIAIAKTQLADPDFPGGEFRLAIDALKVHQVAAAGSVKFAREVYAIGYPRDVWDEIDHQPVVRRGVTATSPALNYKGMPRFIVDIESDKGASGSPVVTLEQSASPDGQSDETHMRLLGIVVGGLTHSGAPLRVSHCLKAELVHDLVEAAKPPCAALPTQS